jgi:hypothetical protein
MVLFGDTSSFVKAGVPFREEGDDGTQGDVDID